VHACDSLLRVGEAVLLQLLSSPSPGSKCSLKKKIQGRLEGNVPSKLRGSAAAQMLTDLRAVTNRIRAATLGAKQECTHNLCEKRILMRKMMLIE
jgi:hypothetical protein